jgi:hypothetical protein
MLVEKIYLSFYIQAIIIVASYMIFNGVYTGELHNSLLDTSGGEVFVLMLGSILSFIIAYYLYKVTIRKKIVYKKFTFKLNLTAFANFYFILLIASFIFMITTGVGVVLSHATSPYSLIFNFLNVSVIFPIFYFLLRESKEISKKYFFLIVAIFILYKLLQGWSGIILTIFIFELYFFYRNKHISKVKKIALIIFLPLLSILIGAKLYQEIYPIKNEIRGLGYHQIEYTDGLVKLVNRLTSFPISVGAYSKIDEIGEFYKEEGVFLKESVGTFRPVAPRAVMENKEFRSLNNNVLQPFFYNITTFTSSQIGILMYIANLFNASLIDGLVWIFLSSIMLFIAKFLYDNLSQFRGQLNFLYFMLILKFFVTASPEIVFGYHFFGILYFIPIFFILGILKIKKNKGG